MNFTNKNHSEEWFFYIIRFCKSYLSTATSIIICNRAERKEKVQCTFLVKEPAGVKVKMFAFLVLTKKKLLFLIT